MDENRKIARSLQSKFDFYFLALVFTTLGLSIQTARFSSSVQFWCEILSWMMLLISGLMGLSRLEWMPAMYRNYSHLSEGEARLRQAHSGRAIVNEAGVVWSKAEIERVVKASETDVSRRKAWEETLERRHMCKQIAHKWFFVLGIVLLILSRAIWLSRSANDLPSAHGQSTQIFSGR